MYLLNIHKNILIYNEMIKKFIICLAPGNIEDLLDKTRDHGNMALNGVYLDIYNKRNLFYFSLPVMCISYINNCAVPGLLYSGLTLTLFTYSVYKWREFLFAV
jgi:hypothetical protein